MERYHEYKQRVENQLSELKARVKDAELKKEDALNEQTRLSIELQNLRIDVSMKCFRTRNNKKNAKNFNNSF